MLALMAVVMLKHLHLMSYFYTRAQILLLKPNEEMLPLCCGSGILPNVLKWVALPGSAQGHGFTLLVLLHGGTFRCHE